MRRKRRCRVCGRWFLPHPRAGARQRTCSRPECQRERHRRACEDWHLRHPHYDREDRLRRRLRREAREGELTGSSAPLGQIDWQAARDAVGLQGAVLAEEMGEVLVAWTRDAVAAKPMENTEKSTKVSPQDPRDEIARAPKPP